MSIISVVFLHSPSYGEVAFVCFMQHIYAAHQQLTAFTAEYNATSICKLCPANWPWLDLAGAIRESIREPRQN